MGRIIKVGMRKWERMEEASPTLSKMVQWSPKESCSIQVEDKWEKCCLLGRQMVLMGIEFISLFQEVDVGLENKFRDFLGGCHSPFMSPLNFVIMFSHFSTFFVSQLNLNATWLNPYIWPFIWAFSLNLQKNLFHNWECVSLGPTSLQWSHIS